MRREILFFIGLLIIAPLAAMALALLLLHPVAQELADLAQIFVGAEAVALVLGFVAYRAIMQLRLANIQVKVALGYALGFGITALIVMLVSMPMFISAHDLDFLLVVLVFAGIVSLAFGYFLSRSITHGLAQLMRSAENIARLNLGTRAEVKSGDEVERLATTFNRMAAHLEESFAKQKELEQARRDVVAAVSHDLRTPLASLRAMLEARTVPGAKSIAARGRFI